MTLALGDVEVDSTIIIPFHTFASAGGSVTITDFLVTDIEIYKDGSVTQRTSDDGITLLDTDGIDFDTLTGIHGFSIDLSDDDDAGFYAARSSYFVVVSAITVDGQAISFVAATFIIKPKIWDEVLTGANYNINNSAGKRLRILGGEVFTDGTAQSGGNNTIQLASGDIDVDDRFVRAKVIITGGLGQGQECIITDSVASTDTLTVTPAWTTNPDNTSEYIVVPAQVHSTVRNGGYDGGFVYVNTVTGSSGQLKGVNGTSTNPSDNLTDAYAIAVTEKINQFFVEPGSALTLPAASTNRKFIGRGYTVALNGADIDNSFFEGVSAMSGIATAGSGNAPNIQLSGVGTCTLPPFTAFQCGFFGTVTLGTEGNTTIGGSSTVFNLPFVIDYGAALDASQVFFQSWGGGQIEIQNAGAGTGTYLLDMNGTGDLLINANCSATTTVDLHGNIKVTNNASGITIDPNYTEVNIKEVNDIEVIGDGETGTEWNPV